MQFLLILTCLIGCIQAFDWSQLGDIGSFRGIVSGDVEDGCLSDELCLEELADAIEQVLADNSGFFNIRHLRGGGQERRLCDTMEACVAEGREFMCIYFGTLCRRRDRDLFWVGSASADTTEPITEEDVLSFLENGCWFPVTSDTFASDVRAAMDPIFDTTGVTIEKQVKFC